MRTAHWAMIFSAAAASLEEDEEEEEEELAGLLKQNYLLFINECFLSVCRYATSATLVFCRYATSATLRP